VEVGDLVDVRVHVNEIEIIDGARWQLKALLPAALAVFTLIRVAVFALFWLHLVHVILGILGLKSCSGWLNICSGLYGLLSGWLGGHSLRLRELGWGLARGKVGLEGSWLLCHGNLEFLLIHW